MKGIDSKGRETMQRPQTGRTTSSCHQRATLRRKVDWVTPSHASVYARAKERGVEQRELEHYRI